MADLDQPAEFSVRFKRLDPSAGAERLLVVADVPAAVIVVPVQGKVAITRVGVSAADLDAVIADIADREDVGDELVALLRAATATGDD